MRYKKKKHHYVSKFYLENFAFNRDNQDEAKEVFAMNKKGIIHKPNKVTKICRMNNYNTLHQEEEQSQREQRYSESLRKFVEIVESSSTEFYRDSELLEFISFMLGNNIFVRETLIDLFKIKIVQNGVDLDNQVVRDKSIKGKYDWSDTFSKCFLEELQSMKFVAIKNELGKKGFITSDKPVSIFYPEDVFGQIDVKLKCDDSKATASILNTSDDRIDIDIILPLIDVSFGSDIVLGFPVLPEIGLIGFSDNRRYNYFIENEATKSIEFLNIMTYNQANKTVYSHSKELLKETSLNMSSYRDYCDKNNITPSFEVGIR